MSKSNRKKRSNKYIDSSEEEEQNQETEQQLTKKQKRKLKEKSKQELRNANPDKPTCAVCHAQFESRTKLFQHIKESGHAALKSAMK